MKVLILGMDKLGKSLATQLKAIDYNVVGTTTNESSVKELQTIVENVSVLRGEQTDKVITAAAGCEAIIVTVPPTINSAKTIRNRQAHYNNLLVKSCFSARIACPRVIFLSSLSVYKNTFNDKHEEFSLTYNQKAEQEVLYNNAGCVLRCPNMYDNKNYSDVVGAVIQILKGGLKGVYNVGDDGDVLSANNIIYDVNNVICAKEHLAPISFINQFKKRDREAPSKITYKNGYSVAQHA